MSETEARFSVKEEIDLRWEESSRERRRGSGSTGWKEKDLASGEE